MTIIEFDEESYRQSVLTEVRAEMINYRHSSLAGLRLKEFVSRSNGKDRKKRRHPREVTLLIYNQTAYQIVLNEVVRRKSPALAIDVVANEALSFLPHEERTVDNLIHFARQNK